MSSEFAKRVSLVNLYDIAYGECVVENVTIGGVLDLVCDLWFGEVVNSGANSWCVLSSLLWQVS